MKVFTEIAIGYLIINLIGCAGAERFTLPKTTAQNSISSQPQTLPVIPPEIPPTPTPSPTPSPTATPTLGPTPPECPCLVRWGVKRYTTVDASGKNVKTPVLGGYTVFDTTPYYAQFPGDKNGGACNMEEDNCGRRKCEDPRGPLFEVTGPSNWYAGDQSYQVMLGPMQSGRHEIIAYPRPDFRDAEGRKVKICEGDGSGYAELIMP